MKLPMRYVPKNISAKDKKKQVRMLLKSKKLYKDHKYFTRKPIASFKNKKSNHVADARRIYKVDNVNPGRELAAKTGCTVSALKQIVKKGEGAYFSSGSRPNQTAQSWGLARLASSITGGKSAAVDYKILESGCNHGQKAFKLANQAKKKYGFGHSKTKKVEIN